MKDKLRRLVARWHEFAEISGNADWTDGIRRCADELEAALAAWEPTEQKELSELRKTVENLEQADNDRELRERGVLNQAWVRT